MKSERIVNPLKRRRINSGLSQKDMADRLGVTQSQYSRIESAKTEPTKYLDELGEIFGCLPDEVFGHAILKEIEDEYLSDTSKTQRMEYHEKRLDAVYLNLKGWFSKKELDLLMDTIDEGFANIRRWKQEQERDDFKQRLADSVARAKVEADERVRNKVGNEGGDTRE
jgi:transcriptional regulator with XRE-family HTH domain